MRCSRKEGRVVTGAQSNAKGFKMKNKKWSMYTESGKTSLIFKVVVVFFFILSSRVMASASSIEGTFHDRGKNEKKILFVMVEDSLSFFFFCCVCGDSLLLTHNTCAHKYGKKREKETE